MNTPASQMAIDVAAPHRDAALLAVARTTASASTRSYSKLFWAFLYVVSLALIVALLVNGYDYYTTPYAARPRHTDYATLRPAGTLGVIFGIAGAAMMSLMLLYSVRKRARFASRWGTLRQWLNLHIYLGIMGPLFIVLHTSFKIQGLVAVSFWSMVGVALSGFFGRYLYHQIPRGIQGTQLSMEELETQNEEIAQRLQTEFGLPAETVARIDQMSVGTLSEDMSLYRLFLAMIRSDLETTLTFRIRQAELARTLGLPEEHLHDLMELTRERLKLKRRILLLAQVRSVFHYWHVIHKPFAVVMYVIMVVHITVALWTGYAWRM